MQVHDSGWQRWLHTMLCALGLRQRAEFMAPTQPRQFVAPPPVAYAPPAPPVAVAPEAAQATAPRDYSYALRDDFLSPAEASFFHLLRQVVADRYAVFPKVRLADLVFPPRQEGQFGAWQRINRKHVDFVLGDPRTLRPVAALELDDRSHRRPDRLERDAFVDRVFADAGLPLVHVPAQRTYHTEGLAALLAGALPGFAPGTSVAPPVALVDRAPAAPTPLAAVATPLCTRCGGEMRLRTAAQGQRRGEQFWGCANYPRCRNTAPFVADAPSRAEA